MIDLQQEQHTLINLTDPNVRTESEQTRLHNEEVQKQIFGKVIGDTKTAIDTLTAQTLEDNEQTLLSVANSLVREAAPKEALNSLFKETKAFTDPAKIKPAILERAYGESMVADARMETSEADEQFVADFITGGNSSFINEEDLAKEEVEIGIINSTRDGIADLTYTEHFQAIGARMLPFVQSALDYLTLPVGGYKLLPSEVREQQREYVLKARDKMSVEDYKGFLYSLADGMKQRGLDQYAISEFFEDVFTTNTAFEDTIQLLDVVGVGKLIKAGNTTRAASKITTSIKNGEKTTEVLKHTNTSLMNPVKTQTLVSKVEDAAIDAAIKDSVAESLQSSKGFQAIQETLTFKNPRNIQRDAEMHAKKLKEVLPKKVKGFLDQDLYSTVENADGSYDMIVKMGTGKTGTAHFRTEAAAKKFVQNNTTLIEGRYNIVRDSEGYFVEGRYTVPSAGIEPNAAAYQDEGKPWKTWGIGRWIVGAANVPNKFQKADVAVTKATARLRNIGMQYLSKIERLKGTDADAFDATIKDGILKEVWFDDDYLKSVKEFNDTQIEAYHAFKEIEDINYTIANDLARSDLASKGYKKIKLNEDDVGFFGKTIDSVTEPNTTTFYDAVEDKIYHVGEMSQDILQDLLKKGDRAIVMKHSAEALQAGETPIKFVLVARKSAQVLDLPSAVVQYVPGGRRIYAPGTRFAKVARVARSGSKQVVLRPLTLFADVDKKLMTEKVDELNTILRAVKDNANKMSKAELGVHMNELTAGFKHYSIGTFEELEELVKVPGSTKKGLIDPRMTVEIVEDGQELSDTARLLQEGAYRLDDSDDFLRNSLQDLADANSRGYFRRGEHLKDVSGNPAPIMSFKDSARRSVSIMVRNKTLPQYTKWWASEFKRLFSDVINPFDLRNMSDRELILHGRLMDTKEAIGKKSLRNKINAAKTMQDKWRIITEQPTEWDNRLATYMNHLADSLGESYIGKAGWFNRGTKSWEALAKANPIAFARFMTFQTFLALGNIRQLWVQALGAFNAVAISPLQGLRAVTLYGPLRACMKLSDDKSIGVFSKAAAKLAGVDSKTFRGMIQDLRKMGAYDAEDLMGFLDEGYIMSTNRLNRASTFFYREGERFNTLVANTAAYLEHLSKTGKRPVKDSEFFDIMRRADDLSLNMSKASETRLQKGSATQLVAQFTNYPVRFFEAVFLGNTKEKLSVRERALLAFANISAFGITGTLGVNWASEVFGEYTPESTAEEGFWFGWLDYALKQYGLDISVSSSAGPQLLDTVWNMMTDIGPQRIPAAGAVETLYGTAAALAKTVNEYMYPQDTTGSDLRNLALMWGYENKTIPALRNSSKALYALATGKLLSQNLEVLKKDVEPMEAFMYALGFKSDTEENLSRAIRYSLNKKELIADVIEDTRKLWNSVRLGEMSMEEFGVFTRATVEALETDSLKWQYYKALGNIYRTPINKEQQQLYFGLKQGDLTAYEIYKGEK